MPEIPRKSFYKLNEVCQYTDTQPYVLRFWESEFPQLGPAKNRGGQRVYRRQDIDLVLRIKRLLYEEEYTIAGARRKLEEETDGNGPEETRAPAPAANASPPAEPAGSTLPAVPEPDAVPRDRYEDAVDEIENLRFQLREAEKKRRKLEAALEKAEQAIDRQRERSEKVIARLEKLMEALS